MKESKTLKFLGIVLGMSVVLLTWPVVADDKKSRNNWVFQSSGTQQGSGGSSGSGSTQTPQEKKSKLMIVLREVV
ncbi:MAG: hypothetical protein BWK78_04305 [Thiotrichaceae bacterium IS1]|nr:MAG: hypothetical protein BWK78_04305 [Thiotrichaceae bacterium IS1]